MNIMTESKLKYFIAKAISCLEPDAKDYWLLCMEKYDTYIKAVVADILRNYDYYFKNEDHYKELSEAVQQDRANWESLRNGLLLCNVINSQVSYWEDKEAETYKNNTESRERYIRQSLIKQLTLAYVSAQRERKPFSWEGRLIFDSIPREKNNASERCIKSRYMSFSFKPSLSGKEAVSSVQRGIDPPEDIQKAMEYLSDYLGLMDTPIDGYRRYYAKGAVKDLPLQKDSLYNLKFYQQWIYNPKTQKPVSKAQLEKAYYGY